MPANSRYRGMPLTTYFRASESQPGDLTTWEEERPSDLPTTMGPGCPGACSKGRHLVPSMQAMF